MKQKTRRLAMKPRRIEDDKYFESSIESTMDNYLSSEEEVDEKEQNRSRLEYDNDEIGKEI